MDSETISTLRWGYVYLKTHRNAKGLHKIGLTRSPAGRKEQLGGDDCVVVARVMTLDPEGLERSLHQQFADKRLPQSEWFNLDEEDLKTACSVLVAAHEDATRYVVLPKSPVTSKPEPKQSDPAPGDCRQSTTESKSGEMKLPRPQWRYWE